MTIHLGFLDFHFDQESLASVGGLGGGVVSTCDLPLLYFEDRYFRIFLPECGLFHFSNTIFGIIGIFPLAMMAATTSFLILVAATLLHAMGWMSWPIYLTRN